MKRVLAAALLTASCAAWAVNPGQTAPDFTLTDTHGNPVRLSDQKGKIVVLEWTNPDCPYVQKHYNSANMPSLQKEYGGRQVVWLSINSTREGHAEFKTPQQMNGWMKEKGGVPAATLLDRDSKVGRLYDATNTPHMYVIDPKGTLIYVGAIDDKRSTNPADVKTAKNYVRLALEESMAGKPVSTPSTTAYGCTVKY